MSDADSSFEAEYNRMLDGFATLINQQQSSMGSSINTIASALIQMAEQVSAALNYTAGIMRVLVPSAPPFAGTSSLGIVPVRVVNDVSQPLPVQVVQQEERRRGFIGQGFTNLLGGIGSLIGNLAGGVAGGILSGAFSPITSLALGGELIVLVGELIFLFGRIRRAVRELLGGLAFLMSDFFDQMYKAGLLPLSGLIASVMAEVDKYLMTNLSRFVGSIMAEVMTHLIPYLRWLIIELVNWTGELINGLRRWFTDSLPVIIPFLGKLIDYLYKTTVKDLIKDLLDTLLSLFPVLKMMVSQLLYDVVYPFLQTAIHNLYISTIRDLVHDALYTLVYPFMLWAVPGLVIAIRNATGLRSPQPPGPIPPVPPPTPGLALKQQPVPVDLRSMLRLFFPAPPVRRTSPSNAEPQAAALPDSRAGSA
jgi:hypothetical protein